MADDPVLSHQEMLDLRDARSGYPDWYRPSRSRRNANALVMRGLHPFGAELNHDPSAKCGDCEHAERREAGNSRFYKCTLSKVTAGRATDLVLSWRACVDFEPNVPAHLRPDSLIVLRKGEPVKLYHARDRWEATTEFWPSTARPPADAVIRVGSELGQVMLDRMIESGRIKE